MTGEAWAVQLDFDIQACPAQERIGAWRNEYNVCRPRSSLGYLTPNEYVVLTQTTGPKSEKFPSTNCTGLGEA